MIIVITATYTPINVTSINKEYSNITNLSLIPPELVKEYFTDFKTSIFGSPPSTEPMTNHDLQLAQNGSAPEDTTLNLVIFVISVAVVVVLILILVALRKTIYSKLPGFMQKQLTKVMNMLMYNSILRFVIVTYQSKFLNAVVSLQGKDVNTVQSALAIGTIACLSGFILY